MKTNSHSGLAAGLLAAIAVSTTGIAGCGSENEAGFVEDALQYRQKGDNKSAIIQLKNALQKNPENAEARLRLGETYNDIEDYQSAEKELRRALALKIDAAAAWPSLGRALLAMGKYQVVIDETTNNANVGSSAAMLSLHGNAYLGLAKWTQARNAFAAALKINENDADALMGMARISLLDKDEKGALRFAKAAVDANRDNADAWLFYAELLRAQRISDDALLAYEQALRVRPSFLGALVGRALLYTEQKEFASARADIAAARKLKPGALQAIYAQALVDFNEGKHQAALESLQQILRAAPNHAPTLLLAGAVNYALGSTQQAELHLKAYLDSHPGNKYARKMLALSLLKNGDPEQAIASLRTELRDPSKAEDAQLLAIAGEAYLKSKDYDKASQYLEKAAALAPDVSMIRTALGRSKLADGESDSAVKELETALQLEPRSKEPGILLVLTHLSRKEYDKALIVIGSLEKASGDDPMLHNLKGAVYVGKTQLDLARRSFEKALAIQPKFFPAVQNLSQLDIQEKKPDVARRRLEEFLKLDESNVPAMHALANLVAAQGKMAESIALMERAYTLKPESLKTAVMLGAQYLRAGLAQKALVHAKNVQVQHARNVDALDLLAQAHLANKDFAGAVNAYTEITSIQPSLVSAYYRLANVHFQAKDVDASITALRKVLSLQPDHLDAQLVLATLEAQGGRTTEAFKIAKKLQTKGATAPSGHLLEGDLHYSQRRFEQARLSYEKSYQLASNGTTMVKMHQAMLQLKREEEADSRLLQWLQAHPADGRTRLYFAQSKLNRKQFKSAIQQLEIILEVDPSNPVVLNNLAYSYHQEKDKRALGLAEKAHSRAPNSADVMDTLAWILLEHGETKRSVDLLQKATKLAPDAVDIRYHLAIALLKSGDREKARQELSAVISNGKTFADLDEAKRILSTM